jgi:hypothetical protein
MTLEDYNYIKAKCAYRVAIIYYTIEEDGVVQIAYNSITLTFRDSDQERNIERMTNIEKTPGFMFWHGSKESEEFKKLNGKAISEYFLKALQA